jgi:glycerol-3-phosphate dehydrogenase
LIGVWHKYSEMTPDQIVVEQSELKAYLDEANRIYDGLDLSLSDVTMVNTGLILFGSKARQNSADSHSFAKRSLVIDHEKRDQVKNLVTLIGVRATVARGDAQHAVGLVLSKLGKRAKPSKTDFIPIFGGAIDNFEDFLRQALASDLRGLDPQTARAIIHNYGSEYGRVIRYAADDPSLMECLEGSRVLKAEVVHAVREEMACALEDVVFRRTELGTGSDPGSGALRQCADIMAREMNWSTDRIEEEMDKVRKLFSGRGPWLNR